MTDEANHGSPDSHGSPHERLESAKTHAHRAAEDLRAAAEAKVYEFKGQAESAWNQARGRATNLQEETEEFIKANPTKSVLYALGVGVVLGFFLRR